MPRRRCQIRRNNPVVFSSFVVHVANSSDFGNAEHKKNLWQCKEDDNHDDSADVYRV